MTASLNRRQFWRAHFSSPVVLTLHGQASEAALQDISLKGALVEVPSGWPGRHGDSCQLRLILAGDAAIDMSAAVAHVEGSRIGLRCENIDLDSITHLRRLVELNSGDPALLERELPALLHEAA